MRKWKRRNGQGITADARDPGAWLDIGNMVPVGSGAYRTAPTFVTYGTAAASGFTGATPMFTAVTLYSISVFSAATPVIYVGSGAFVLSASFAGLGTGTFTDRTPAGWSSPASWVHFAQLGNTTLMAAYLGGVKICSRDITGGSAFAEIAAAPLAKIVVVQSNAVLAFCITGAENSWQASNVGDHTNWTTGDAVTVTAINHRHGNITAAIAYRDDVIAFKDTSAYRLHYVGQPEKWTVQLISETLGAFGPNSVCACGENLVFYGAQGFTLFDGASFRSINDDVYLYDLLVDETMSMQWFPSDNALVVYNGASTSDDPSIFVYSFVSKAWGKFSVYRSGSTYTTTSKSQMLIWHQLAAAASLFNGGMVMIDMGTNPCVVVSQLAWTSSKVAYLISSYVGSDEQINRYSVCIPLTKYAGATAPAATGMSLVTIGYDTPMTAQASGTALETVTSETNQRKFPLAKAMQWISAKLNINDGGAAEVEDLLFLPPTATRR